MKRNFCAFFRRVSELTATLSSVQLKSGHYLHDYQTLYGAHVMSQSILVQKQNLKGSTRSSSDQ